MASIIESMKYFGWSRAACISLTSTIYCIIALPSFVRNITRLHSFLVASLQVCLQVLTTTQHPEQNR